MFRIPSHRQLVHLQAWLAGSFDLRQRLRRRLLAPVVVANRSAPLFHEVLVEWDDSPC
jgi:hypothetical protein